MSNKVLWLSIAAVALSFVGGFLLANSINRSEMNSLRAQLESARNPITATSDGDSRGELSREEIQAKINEADAKPDNFNFQKNLGLALAQYGSSKEDVWSITQATRLLDRASALDPNDVDIIVGQGNAAFNIGLLTKDNQLYQKARGYYEKALEKKPKDADIHTNLGMTYFTENPPNDDQAITEFKQALSLDSKNTKALALIAQAFLHKQNRAEAEKYLAKLRQTDPNNEALPGLTAQVEGENDGAPK